MVNQYNPQIRLHARHSCVSLSSVMICIVVVLQGLLVTNAELNQYDAMMPSGYKFRTNSTTSTVSTNDDAAYEAGADIYDDNNEDFDDVPSSTSQQSLSPSRSKLFSNLTSRSPVPIEEAQKSDYEDESESYQNEPSDEETTHPDDSHLFSDPKVPPPSNPQSDLSDSNLRKDVHLSSTVRMPFFPTNLWHNLFSKPGILVGIIGGVVIGMLSAILLVMFIIYRMRKKDEGSYALEEGPRKSPSHAYTRVSSREFFA